MSANAKRLLSLAPQPSCCAGGRFCPAPPSTLNAQQPPTHTLLRGSGLGGSFAARPGGSGAEEQRGFPLRDGSDQRPIAWSCGSRGSRAPALRWRRGSGGLHRARREQSLRDVARPNGWGGPVQLQGRSEAGRTSVVLGSCGASRLGAWRGPARMTLSPGSCPESLARVCSHTLAAKASGLRLTGHWP